MSAKTDPHLTGFTESPSRRAARWLCLCSFIGLSVIASVWWLPIRQYWIHVPAVDSQAIRQAVEKPDKATLEVVVDSLELPLGGDDESEQHRRQRVDDIMNGVAVDPITGPRRITIPFSVEEVINGSDEWQLLYAGLSLPALVLDQYEKTGDRRQLVFAGEMIEKFIEWEEGVHWPVGFVWNDHALVNRLGVLLRFWRYYREDPSFAEERAGEMLRAVERIATRLARHDVFTYNTNHGVMQNLGLIRASIAFPTLPDADRWGQIGRQRLIEQMSFLISPEGYFLEHSPEYHGFGTALLSSAISLGRLLEPAFPLEWADLLRRGREIQSWMMRPDGSLPVFGDSQAGPPPKFLADAARRKYAGDGSPASGASDDSFGLYPVSGLAGWSTRSTDGAVANHTTTSWGYFTGHGHSHADELSLALWLAGGVEILNAGYWPYGLPGRNDAVSWRGGNAPHFVDESVRAQRPFPELTAFVAEGDIHGVAMRRAGELGVVQRQLLQIGANTWIVLDSFEGRHQDVRGEVIWRINGNVQRLGNRSLVWRNGAGDSILKGMFAGVDFAPTCDGRAAFASGVKSVSCVALQSAGAPSAILSVWVGESAVSGDDDVRLEFSSPRQWTLSGLTGGTWITVTRTGDKLLLGSRDARTREVWLQTPPDVAGEHLRLEESRRKVASRYPKYVSLDDYRWRATRVGLGLLVVQAMALAVIFWKTPARARPLSLAVCFLWLCAGWYLHAVYFVVD